MSLEKSKQVAPFHFYVDIGKYTGLSAASYEDFRRTIKQVKMESLIFHLERGDFEKWATDVLKDKKLTEEIAKIRNRKLRPGLAQLSSSGSVKQTQRIDECTLDTACSQSIAQRTDHASARADFPEALSQAV